MGLFVSNSMANLADLVATLTLKADDFIKGVTEAMDKFDLLKGALTGAITAAPFVAITEAATQFQEVMHQLRAETGLTGDALTQMGEIVQKGLADIPVPIEAATQAVIKLNQRLGETGPQLEESAALILNLAHVLGADMNTAVDDATKLFNAWGISVEQQTATMDMLLNAVHLSGIGLNDLLGEVNRGQLYFQQLGLSLQDSVSILGEFNKAGINTQVSMFALRNIVTVFTKENRDTAGALQEVVAEIKNAGSAAEVNAISLAYFGSRGKALGQAIAEGKVDFDAFSAALSSSGDTVAKVAAETDTFADKMLRFQKEVTAAIQPIGEGLINALGSLMEAAKPVLDIVRLMAEGFAALPSPIQDAAFALAALAAVMITAQVAFSALSFTGILAGFGTVATMAGTFVEAISSIGAALIGGGGLVAALTVGETILLTVGVAVAAVAAIWGAWKLGEWANNNIPFVHAAFQALWDVMKGIGTFISDVFVIAWAGLKTAAEAFLGVAVVPFLEFMRIGFVNLYHDALDVYNLLVKLSSAVIPDWLVTSLKNAGQGFVNLAEDVKTAADAIHEKADEVRAAQDQATVSIGDFGKAMGVLTKQTMVDYTAMLNVAAAATAMLQKEQIALGEAMALTQSKIKTVAPTVGELTVSMGDFATVMNASVNQTLTEYAKLLNAAAFQQGLFQEAIDTAKKTQDTATSNYDKLRGALALLRDEYAKAVASGNQEKVAEAARLVADMTNQVGAAYDKAHPVITSYNAALNDQLKALKAFEGGGTQEAIAALTAEVDEMQRHLHAPNQGDTDAEWVKYWEDKVKLAHTNGQKISDAVQQTLDDLKAALKLDTMDTGNALTTLAMSTTTGINQQIQAVMKAYDQLASSNLLSATDKTHALALATQEVLTLGAKVGLNIPDDMVLKAQAADAAWKLLTITLATAFSGLGVTSTNQLTNNLAQIEAEYQKVVDAFENGSASAQDVLNADVARLTKEEAAYKATGQAMDDVAVARLNLENTLKTIGSMTTEDAFKFYGLLTQADLDNAVAIAKAAWDKIIADAGAGSLAENQAELGYWQKLSADATKAGKVVSDEVTARIEELQATIKAKQLTPEVSMKLYGFMTQAELDAAVGYGKQAYDQLVASGASSTLLAIANLKNLQSQATDEQKTLGYVTDDLRQKLSDALAEVHDKTTTGLGALKDFGVQTTADAQQAIDQIFSDLNKALATVGTTSAQAQQLWADALNQMAVVANKSGVPLTDLLTQVSQTLPDAFIGTVARLKDTTDAATRALDADWRALGITSIDVLDRRLKAEQTILETLKNQNAPEQQQLQAEIAVKQLEIDIAAKRGESATHVLDLTIQLENARIKEKALYDQATNLATLYTSVVHIAADGWKEIGTNLGDAIAGAQSFNDAWKKSITDIEKKLAELIVNTILGSLKDALLANTNILKSWTGILDTILQKFGLISKASAITPPFAGGGIPGLQGGVPLSGGSIPGLGGGGPSLGPGGDLGNLPTMGPGEIPSGLPGDITGAGGSGAGGALGSITGALTSSLTGAITGIVGAIGSVFTGIETMVTNNKLATIEGETRYTMIYTETILELHQETNKVLYAIHSALIDYVSAHIDFVLTELQSLHADFLKGAGSFTASSSASDTPTSLLADIKALLLNDKTGFLSAILAKLADLFHDFDVYLTNFDSWAVQLLNVVSGASTGTGSGTTSGASSPTTGGLTVPSTSATPTGASTPPPNVHDATWAAANYAAMLAYIKSVNDPIDAAMKDLTAAITLMSSGLGSVADITTSVAALKTDLATPGLTPDQIKALKDEIASLTTALNETATPAAALPEHPVVRLPAGVETAQPELPPEYPNTAPTRGPIATSPLPTPEAPYTLPTVSDIGMVLQPLLTNAPLVTQKLDDINTTIGMVNATLLAGFKPITTAAVSSGAMEMASLSGVPTPQLPATDVASHIDAMLVELQSLHMDFISVSKGTFPSTFALTELSEFQALHKDTIALLGTIGASLSQDVWGTLKDIFHDVDVYLNDFTSWAAQVLNAVGIGIPQISAANTMLPSLQALQVAVTDAVHTLDSDLQTAIHAEDKSNQDGLNGIMALVKLGTNVSLNAIAGVLGDIQNWLKTDISATLHGIWTAILNGLVVTGCCEGPTAPAPTAPLPPAKPPFAQASPSPLQPGLPPPVAPGDMSGSLLALQRITESFQPLVLTGKLDTINYSILSLETPISTIPSLLANMRATVQNPNGSPTAPRAITGKVYLNGRELVNSWVTFQEDQGVRP